MSFARILLLLVLVNVSQARAGHGFMNSFDDIEWLPEPGITPDRPYYALDRLGELIGLLVAKVRGDALARNLSYAREKLAEASAMLIKDQPAAAQALGYYRDYLERAAALVDAQTGQDPRYRYINAVLEHVYIMSVDYVDMPLELRERVLNPMFDQAMVQFRAQRARLSVADQKALFFKEEEIRWSLEMTVQADRQKIFNE